MNGQKLRVVWIGGAPPTDGSHLEEASRHVDLSIYYSRWQRGPGSPLPRGVASRGFDPLVRSRRGHLAFVYPGLHRALDCDRPEVVHVISEPWGLLAVQAARWARKNPQAKLVVHGCDTIWHHGGTVEQWGRRAILHRTMGEVDAYVAENSKALDLAVENGLPTASARARVHTNPRNRLQWRRPTPAERGEARAALGLGEHDVAVGLLGRLVEQKGVLIFLDAAEELIRRGFPGRFLVAGEGPLAAEVRRRRSASVMALGSLPHPTGVVQFLQALDVLACPSLATPGWEDQGPRSLLEAMMCGCIPVASSTGGMPEMVGGHGVLATEPSATVLADAIIEAAALAADPAERSRISQWSESLYSDRAVAGQLVELWTGLATPNRPAVR